MVVVNVDGWWGGVPQRAMVGGNTYLWAVADERTAAWGRWAFFLQWFVHFYRFGNHIWVESGIASSRAIMIEWLPGSSVMMRKNVVGSL